MSSGCAATRCGPTLILLDVVIPLMNGWEFRAEQLGDSALADIPVVVMSAAERAEAAGEALVRTSPSTSTFETVSRHALATVH